MREQTCPALAAIWPKPTKLENTLPKFDEQRREFECWPKATQLGRQLVAVGQMLADVVQIWTMFAQCLLTLAVLGQFVTRMPLFARSGPTTSPTLAMFCKIWVNDITQIVHNLQELGQQRPSLDDICPNLTKSDQLPTKLCRGGPTLVEIWSTLVIAWQSASKFGRFGPDSGQSWPNLLPHTNLSILIPVVCLDITEMRTYRHAVPCRCALDA